LILGFLIYILFTLKISTLCVSLTHIRLGNFIQCIVIAQEFFDRVKQIKDNSPISTYSTYQTSLIIYFKKYLLFIINCKFFVTI